jgi:hypothetical protein
MLLDDQENAEEVLCEHHEDVLIKHADGTFSGLQIKTRGEDQDIWKTSDDDVRVACARFVKLDALFPGQFRNFRFLTNHPLHAAQNGKSLCHVLQITRTLNAVGDVSKPIASFLKCVADKADCTVDAAFATLSKTDADDTLPKRLDIIPRLVDTLTRVWNRAADCSYASVMRAALSLVLECERASSLAHEDILPAYLPATTDPESTEIAARLAAKRIDRPRLLEILDGGLSETAPLDSAPGECVEPGSGRRDLLLKKLDAGGFSIVSCNSALDLRDKADYLGIKWTKKHGREQGLQRYGHMRSLVLNDAARAFETAKSDTHSFGLQMLSELRSRFQQRRNDGSLLHECSNEHLEGFAYSLTSECKIQWSNNRPWETE